MPNDDPPPTDSAAEMRAKSEKFGAGYAVMSEVLKGRGVDRAVTVVKIGLAAAAVFVVVAAIVAA